eukprot:UN28795
MNQAKRDDLPAYCIFDNKTFDSLMEIRPKNVRDLLMVRGIGDVKAKRFGPSLLRIFAKHDRHRSFDLNWDSHVGSYYSQRAQNAAHRDDRRGSKWSRSEDENLVMCSNKDIP